jgi:hypothetical protein
VQPQSTGGVTEITCDVLVVGAGLVGVAAALRAARLGFRVCLVEETAWPGGQISTQGVSALDEHQYIETVGGTGTYYELREGIRAYYRERYRLSDRAARARSFNPGNAWVSGLSFEPRVGAAVLDAMMAGVHETGALQVFYRSRAVAAEVYDGWISSVLVRHLENGAPLRFRAPFVLDATDLGDLFPLTATAYRVGAEARSETGEPSAPEAGDPGCVQHFTFPFAVEFCPGEVHTIPKPEGYDRNREAQPYSLAYRPWVPGDPAYRMFDTAPGTYGPFWTYRRALDASNFDDPRVPRDVSIINWTSNDFRGGTLVDRLPEEQAALCRQARLLSLGFLYWLQTEAPRDDGGVGYPELRLRPDVMGSPDGLSQRPYVREGRRLVALTTVREQDIARWANPGPRATRFDDTAGIGYYPIDLHGCGLRILSVPTRPFQIPLGALIPVRTRNLLAAKSIGTTHVTNGAYRLHPVEWAIGEAAGALAAFCLSMNTWPREVWATPRLLRSFQILLLDHRVPLYWYDDVPLDHPAFAAAQLLAIDGAWEGRSADLHFLPDDLLTIAEGKKVVAGTARRLRHWAGPQAGSPESDLLRSEPEDSVLPLRWDAAATLVKAAMPSAPPPPRAVAAPAEAVTRGALALWLAGPLREAIEGRASG